MAVEELFGDLYSQGSVYEATPYAVPFLARIAAAGISRYGACHDAQYTVVVTC